MLKFKTDLNNKQKCRQTYLINNMDFILFNKQRTSSSFLNENLNNLKNIDLEEGELSDSNIIKSELCYFKEIKYSGIFPNSYIKILGGG